MIFPIHSPDIHPEIACLKTELKIEKYGRISLWSGDVKNTEKYAWGYFHGNC